jgi:hypothetical protein
LTSEPSARVAYAAWFSGRRSRRASGGAPVSANNLAGAISSCVLVHAVLFACDEK